MKLEAKYMADGVSVGGVGSQQWHVEVVLFRTTLETLQNDVQHTIRVQIETACHK